MTDRKHKPTKDRRNIGEVRTLMEEMTALRSTSASCVHVEAALEPDSDVSLSRKKSPHRCVREKDRT